MERAIFEADIVSALADIVTSVRKIVIAAGDGQFELFGDRSFCFCTEGPALAITFAGRVDPAEVIGIYRARIGAEIVLLLAELSDSRKADRPRRQAEEFARVDLYGAHRQRASRRIDAVFRDRRIFLRCQRRVKARWVRIEDWQIEAVAIVHAKLSAQEEVIGSLRIDQRESDL